MSLPNAIQTSRRPTLAITWLRTNGEPVSLVGATISGVLQNKGNGAETAITGAFALSDATNGIFTWDFSAADVATAANFYVQFKALFSDSTFELSLPESWEGVAAI